MMAGVVAWAGALIGEMVTLFCVGGWTWYGLHMKTGSSSLKGCGVLTCGVVGSVGGTLSRRSVCRAWIAASLSGRASWTPAIAAVRRAVAWRILSVAVMVGTKMAWWQNRNVSVMCLPPVSATKTMMQRQWLVEWDRYQAFDVWYPHVLRLLGFMCTRTSVPSGAIGVASREKEPSSTSWANRRGFWQQGLSMFRVVSHCVVRCHSWRWRKTWGGRPCRR